MPAMSDPPHGAGGNPNLGGTQHWQAAPAFAGQPPWAPTPQPPPGGGAPGPGRPPAGLPVPPPPPGPPTPAGQAVPPVPPVRPVPYGQPKHGGPPPPPPPPQPPGPAGDSINSTSSLPAITGGAIRRQGTFTGRVTRDGSSGFPAEPGRYQLYASLACPWSQRTLIAARLLGLDRVVGLTLTEPVADEMGWRFGTTEATADPLTGARFVADLYRTASPNYPGPYTIPLLWDLRSRQVVSNDVAQITVMLETEFRAFHRHGAPDLYPAARRREIESLATLIFHTVNTGVYKAGLAVSQAAYEQAAEGLFTTLDALEERLARRRFLLGDQLTEADIRLYPTLARFDAVYYQLFKCNLRRLTDYHHLWAYTRDLYQHPGFGETTELSQIKQHYYRSPEWGNVSGIIPIGPQINWNEPHGRARMPA